MGEIADLEKLLRDQQVHLPPNHPHHGIVRLDLTAVPDGT
jgi:hypothetical protein